VNLQSILIKCLFSTEKEVTLIDNLKSITSINSTIGFVSMGALHVDIFLMQQSLEENDTTVVKHFYNPTQFNNPEDLLKYPRTLGRH
jgi:pantoate--beta-alanine ligase